MADNQRGLLAYIAQTFSVLRDRFGFSRESGMDRALSRVSLPQTFAETLTENHGVYGAINPSSGIRYLKDATAQAKQEVQERFQEAQRAYGESRGNGPDAAAMMRFFDGQPQSTSEKQDTAYDHAKDTRSLQEQIASLRKQLKGIEQRQLPPQQGQQREHGMGW